MKKVIATLRALVEVMEVLSKDAPERVGRLINEEVLSLSFLYSFPDLSTLCTVKSRSLTDSDGLLLMHSPHTRDLLVHPPLYCLVYPCISPSVMLLVNKYLVTW